MRWQLEIVAIDHIKCVGFKTPLFLGGKEEILNCEICDLEIYWDFEFQLFQQVKNLPEGTRIHNVIINSFKK